MISDETNKQKDYYNGLRLAIETLMPEETKRDFDEMLEDDAISEENKLALRLWKNVVGPLSNALAYIVNNRFIVENRDDIMADDACDEPFMMAGEIFNELKRLNKETVKLFITSSIQTDSAILERLFRSYLNDDEAEFERLLLQERCDTTRLARLCRRRWNYADEGFSIESEDMPYFFDTISDDFRNSPGDEEAFEKTERLQSSLIELIDAADSDDDTFLRTLNKYYEDYGQFCKSMFRMYLDYYWDSHDQLKLMELLLIDAILAHPSAQELIPGLRTEYLARKKQDDEEPADFSLPRDFFTADNRHDEPKEYFYLSDDVTTKGVETFRSFIEYLARNGYIDNTASVKALFAYRLTGRCRPEGELPVIIWHGRNGSAYELIYVIKHFTERGDYKKMRRFFHSLNWPKSHYSAYADGANAEFKRSLEKLYPKACKS